MTRTKVVNQTGSSIRLKEGTAGVYRTLCEDLKDGSAYSIKVDQNATYREYWCATLPDDDKNVVLSSDDCMEYEEVRIQLKEDKTTYTWVGVKRGRSRKIVPAAGVKETPGGTRGMANQREPGAVGKAWNKIKGLF